MQHRKIINTHCQFQRISLPTNVAGIQHMPPPSDISGLCSFLGLVSHYGSFLPSPHQIKAPLNKLLTKYIKWTFENIKASLYSDLLLTYFDPTQKRAVVADASSHGVEAVTSHISADKSEKAIMHADRSLTSAEHYYSQVEKRNLH